MEEQKLEQFAAWLRDRERSKNTVEKYVRDARRFLEFAGTDAWGREQVLLYKGYLQKKYKITSVNSMLVALNSYLLFIGRPECSVNICRVQRCLFRDESRELSYREYKKLVRAANMQKKIQLSCILQTIASTGIRVSELKYITVESLKGQMVEIDCKGKYRLIPLPAALVIVLKDYCRKKKIKKGSIFVTYKGEPMDRRNIWAGMKELCGEAQVAETKVFPHNLRHLFARCYYEQKKDLVRLADFLGHSSVETTRRYTMVSSREAYQKQLELGLVFDDKSENLQDRLAL